MRVIRAISVLLVLLIASLAAPPQALADGLIIILPPRPPEPRPMPIPVPPPRPVFFPLAVKYHRVAVSIQAQLATTEIDQVFYNPNPADLEGTYIFPLPEDATVSKFSLFMNGTEVEAELLDAAKARQIYENIVRQMKDPALLEYAGRGMFKARVYPIPARGDARVKLSYQQVLRADAGLCEYRYPLNTEKFSSAPLEEARVDVTVAGAAGSPIGNVFSPSHPVTIERRPEGGAKASWSARNTLPERDFVLFFQKAEADRDLDVSVLTHRSLGEDGTFLMLLAPPTSLTQTEVMPKDVVFVLDTSGSMAGEKMEQAKEALKYCVRSLDARDRFAVIDFATEVRGFKEGMLAATKESVAAAVEYIAEMRARGGTDIHGALMQALALKGEAGRPFHVVFLTDGAPTIGVTAPADIEKAIKAAREARPDKDAVRLFIFGVGTDLNVGLLDRLAEQNRGAREYAAPGESIELKVSRFFDKVAAPVFSDVKIEIPGLEAYDIYPRPMPDLFRGGEVAVVGRFRGEGAKVVKLSGKLQGKAVEVIAKVAFPAEAKAPFLPRAFAVRKIAFLLDQIRLHGETEEVRQEVVRLAKEHGIVTPYTSYLVIEDEKRLSQARPAGARHAAADALEGLRRRADDGYARAEEEAKVAAGEARRAQADAAAGAPAAPVPEAARERAAAASEASKKLAETPLGLTAEPGAELAGAIDAHGRFRGGRTGDAGAGGGASGWADSGAKEKLADRDAAEARLRDVVRVVSGRTFYRQGEVWVDARCAPGAEARRLIYLSDDYFKLVAERPDLGKFLALGARVRLVVDGKDVEVAAE